MPEVGEIVKKKLLHLNMTNETGNKNFRSKFIGSNLEYFIDVNAQTLKPNTDANRKEYDSMKSSKHIDNKIHDTTILKSIARTEIDDYMFQNTRNSQDLDNTSQRYENRQITTDDLDFSSIKAHNYHSSPNMGLSEGAELNEKTGNINCLKVPVNTKRSSTDVETSKPITTNRLPSYDDNIPKFDDFKMKVENFEDPANVNDLTDGEGLKNFIYSCFTNMEKKIDVKMSTITTKINLIDTNNNRNFSSISEMDERLKAIEGKNYFLKK